MATDTVSAAQVFDTEVSELATATDTTQTNVIWLVRIGESGTVTDVSAVAQSAFNVGILESLVATDSVRARFRWEPIDDDQTASWGGIVNTQSPGWVQINNV